VKIVPLVAALAIGGAVAAKTIFPGKKNPGVEVQEKKTRAEKKKEEKARKQKAKVEMLKRIIKFQIMKEGKRVGWASEDEGEEGFPVFDEKGYREALWDYKKNELWKLFDEQCGEVERLEEERRLVLEGMEMELSTGKRFPTEEEEKEERLVLAKLGVERRKHDLVQERIDEMDLSEYGLAGKSREELQAILFSTEEKAMPWGTEYMTWEEEDTLHLASVALHKMFWNEVWGRD